MSPSSTIILHLSFDFFGSLSLNRKPEKVNTLKRQQSKWVQNDVAETIDQLFNYTILIIDQTF